MLEQRRAVVAAGAGAGAGVGRVAGAGDARSAAWRGAGAVAAHLAVQRVHVEIGVGRQVSLGRERVRGAAGERVTALQTEQVQVGL